MYHLFSGQSSLISKISLSFNTNLILFHKFMAIPIVSELTDNFPRGGKNIFAPMILSSILSVRQILSVLFYFIIINLNNKILLFLVYSLLSSILMMNAINGYKFFILFIIIIFLIEGIAPVTWGFSSPLRSTNRPVNCTYALPSDIPFGPGLCPREYVSRFPVTNSSQALKGGRNQQRKKLILPFFLFFVRPNLLASLRLDYKKDYN